MENEMSKHNCILKFLLKIVKFFVNEFLFAGVANEKKIDITKVDMNELRMGIAVEYEHTSSRMLATKIALDHLAEIPDYYTRLARMEEEAFRELGIEEETSNTNNMRLKNWLCKVRK